MAHVQRGDVQTVLIAQLVVALNFFHPLSHLLVRRLRLDQELAADCLAAPLVGGRQTYLQNLAGLALRRADAMFGGPALAFLPSRRTFVRRLEMLRNLRNPASGQPSRWALAIPCFVLLAAFSMTWLKPSFAQNPTPQAPSTPTAQTTPGQIIAVP